MNRNQLIADLKPFFSIKELVCPHCYNKFGDNSWLFLSTELLYTLLFLRTQVFNKPIIVNTWAKGGLFSQRGLRCNMCDLVKGKKNIYMSAHCLGKAVDFNVKEMTSDEVNDRIRECANLFIYPIRLETNTNGWSHIDCYSLDDSKQLVEFNG